MTDIFEPPWISVEKVDGDRKTLSLLDTIVHMDSIRCIDEDPDVTLGILRFTAAFLAVCFADSGLVDRDQYAGLAAGYAANHAESDDLEPFDDLVYGVLAENFGTTLIDVAKRRYAPLRDYLDFDNPNGMGQVQGLHPAGDIIDGTKNYRNKLFPSLSLESASTPRMTRAETRKRVLAQELVAVGGKHSVPLIDGVECPDPGIVKSSGSPAKYTYPVGFGSLSYCPLVYPEGDTYGNTLRYALTPMLLMSAFLSTPVWELDPPYPVPYGDLTGDSVAGAVDVYTRPVRHNWFDFHGDVLVNAASFAGDGRPPYLLLQYDPMASLGYRYTKVDGESTGEPDLDDYGFPKVTHHAGYSYGSTPPPTSMAVVSALPSAGSSGASILRHASKYRKRVEHRDDPMEMVTVSAAFGTQTSKVLGIFEDRTRIPTGLLNPPESADAREAYLHALSRVSAAAGNVTAVGSAVSWIVSSLEGSSKGSSVAPGYAAKFLERAEGVFRTWVSSIPVPDWGARERGATDVEILHDFDGHLHSLGVDLRRLANKVLDEYTDTLTSRQWGIRKVSQGYGRLNKRLDTLFGSQESPAGRKGE